MGIIKRRKVGSYKPKKDNVIKLTKYLENIYKEIEQMQQNTKIK